MTKPVVFIPAAGLGTRVQKFFGALNKPLLRLNNRAVIDDIIRCYPLDLEIIVGVGFRASLVEQYLENMWGGIRSFTFVCVDDFSEESGGLGKTLGAARSLLERPFFFHACDSLVTFPDHVNLSHISRNWVGAAATMPEPEHYRQICHDGAFTSVTEKSVTATSSALNYIGVCAVFDYKSFWASFDEASDRVTSGECAGLRGLSSSLDVVMFPSWTDVGRYSVLEKTLSITGRSGGVTVLPKSGESIYINNSRVVKFDESRERLMRKVLRARRLEPFVPQLTYITENFFRYDFVPGQTLSRCYSDVLFRRALHRANEMWATPIDVQPLTSSQLKADYSQFYIQKTKDRLDMLLSEYPRLRDVIRINDVFLDDDFWQGKIWGEGEIVVDPVLYHGDLHFENMIVSEGNVTFIDWRESYGKDRIDYGDRYYDLGKILHGILVNHDIVADHKYALEWTQNEIEFKFDEKRWVDQALIVFAEFCKSNGYSIANVIKVCGLIFVNIAPLHHYPYNLAVFSYGVTMLTNPQSTLERMEA